MQIIPQESTSEFKAHVCPYHVDRPGAPFAGCTCSASYISKTQRRAVSAQRKAEAMRRDNP